jgi:glycosyltransferase involved in cell wall biosynthesis
MVSSLFSNVIYLRENKKGVSASRNKGISSAKSNWIALLDSDDVWKPEKLEKQIAFNINNPKYRLIHTNEIWYRNNKFLNQLKKHKKSGGDIFKNSLSLCCISPSSTLIKKEIFSDYGYFDESLEVCEDYDMWIRITAKEEVGYVDEPMLIKHGGHSDQLSKKYWGMDRFRIFSLEKNLNGNWFTKEQRQTVINVLIKKLTILTNGANKRGNKEILKEYNDKLLFWINKIDE